MTEEKKKPIKVKPEKVTNMVGTFLKEGNTSNLFKRAISYRYKHIISEFVNARTVKMETEKVTSTVATFLNEGSDCSQIIKVTTKMVVPYKGLHYLSYPSKKSPFNKYSLKKCL